jgi:hypothetical protein
MVLMLFAIINLFGRVPPPPPLFPETFDYKVNRINLNYGIGAKYLYTFTFYIDPDNVTDLQKQRKYSFESDYFTPGESHNSYTVVSSDIQNGQTFTYDQLPITGHVIVKFSGYEGYPDKVHNFLGNIIIKAKVFGFENEPIGTFSEDGPLFEQLPDLDMPLPNPIDDVFNEKVRLSKYYILGIFSIALVIFILYLIIKQIFRINKVDA